LRMKERHWVDIVFALVLFCIFAACVLLTTLTGAATYKKTIQSQQQRFEQNTSLHYIVSKIRSNDNLNAVSLEPFAGETALVLKEVYNGTTYLTRIYYHDGWICELFSEEGLDVGESGISVLPADGLSFALEDGLLTVCLMNQDGTVSKTAVLLRSGTNEVKI
jgi:hypothetical protein